MNARTPVLVALGLALVVLVVVLVYVVRSEGQGELEGASGPGWSSGSAVVTTAEMRSFLDELAARAGVELYVTSGVRSAADQARAMLAKLQADSDALDIYVRGDLVDELLEVDQARWAELIQSQIEAGQYLSAHLTGRALDLRTTGAGVGHLEVDQVDQVANVAAELGADVLEEHAPPHLHIELEEYAA